MSSLSGDEKKQALRFSGFVLVTIGLIYFGYLLAIASKTDKFLGTSVGMIISLGLYFYVYQVSHPK
jgi:hypothetical protein